MQGSKNIVIVSHYYPPHVGGIEMVAYNQAKRLVAAGNHVTVITSKTQGEPKHEIVEGVEVVRVSAFNGFEKYGIPFPIFSPALWPTLQKAVRKADIVHVHDAFYISSFLAALSARLNKKPLVLTQHVAMIFHPNLIVNTIQKITYGTTGAMIFRSSNHIFIYNDRVKKFLIQRGVPESKISALPNGVDIELFHPVSAKEKNDLKKQYGLSLDKKIILFVGRYVPKKGFDKVLAAQSNKYQIAFAGGDTTQKNSEETVFLGKMNTKKLAEVYQTADIFVLPSESEGFPLSIQEAMASGLPIITSHDEGYHAYGLDKKLIYFIDHPTGESVRQTIEEVVADEEKLQSMAAYSKNYAHTNFDWAAVVAKLGKKYHDLVTQVTQTP